MKAGRSLNPCAPSTRAGPDPCGISWHRATSETPFPRIVSDIGEHRVAQFDASMRIKGDAGRNQTTYGRQVQTKKLVMRGRRPHHKTDYGSTYLARPTCASPPSLNIASKYRYCGFISNVRKGTPLLEFGIAQSPLADTPQYAQYRTKHRPLLALSMIFSISNIT